MYLGEQLAFLVLDAGAQVEGIVAVALQFAEAGGREPDKLGDALDAGQELLVAALS